MKLAVDVKKSKQESFCIEKSEGSGIESLRTFKRNFPFFNSYLPSFCQAI